MPPLKYGWYADVSPSTTTFEPHGVVHELEKPGEPAEPGHMNAQFVPVRPTYEPSGQSIASAVHATG